MDALPINLNDIKPEKKGVADFYSWGLYAWLKKRPNAFSIFASTLIDENGNEVDKPVLYIGSKDSYGDIMGAPLRQVCSTAKMPEIYWLSQSRPSNKWEDITDDFYKQYMEIGVCSIHHDLVHKWVESKDGQTRTCQYCDKRETKQVEIVKVEKIKWV
jgi:hypothetical protein